MSQTPPHRRQTLAVEAEPVDQRQIFLQPEQPRLRVAGLRARRDGPDLGETEAQRQDRVRHLGVLVEAGRQADGIGKDPAPEPRRQVAGLRAAQAAAREVDAHHRPVTEIKAVEIAEVGLALLDDSLIE